MDIRVINAIAEAAEREDGLDKIHMVSKKRKWHRCIWSSKHMVLFLYNDDTNTTKAVRIK